MEEPLKPNTYRESPLDSSELPPGIPYIVSNEAAERFVAATGVRIEHGGQRAYYRPSTDHIQMPDEGLFAGTDTMSRDESYYAVQLHELIHWTGASHRLDRQFGKRFGDAAYSAEELTAELGAAFLCSELGITQDTRPDHAQYLAHWLQLLKDDSRAIFTAAAKASQAVAYLKGQLPLEQRCSPAFHYRRLSAHLKRRRKDL